MTERTFPLGVGGTMTPRPKLKPSATSTLGLLRERGPLGLTRKEAIHAGIGNLPARVLELRRAGYRIDAMHWWADSGARYARYFAGRE